MQKIVARLQWTRGELVAALFFALLLSVGTWGGTNVWTTNGPYGGTVASLAIDPQTTSTRYAGTYSGLFKSTDGGATWSEEDTGMGRIAVTALAIDPDNPDTL